MKTHHTAAEANALGRASDITDARPGSPRDSGERVMLVSMPFGALERPALSLGLLQAHCRQLDVPCETSYLNFAFAEHVGLGNYLWLCSDDVPYTAFAGDWLFIEALYGRRPYGDAAYVDEILRRTWRLSDSNLARLLQMRNHVEPFLSQCMDSVRWTDYTFVGFTSVFQQNIASLALAARVKRGHPEITIAFGGANWEGAMGVALQEQFPFVDLAFSGEADESFPAVLEARARGVGMEGIRGVSASARNRVAEIEPVRKVQDLDKLPVPDFDPFFEQKQACPAVAGVPVSLLMETARGCWWGDHSHCTFCGLNGAQLSYRSKTPERVLSEITFLQGRHGIKTIGMVDDILDMNYFRSVFPKLVTAKLDTEFFWEVKANLNRQQVRLLRDASVCTIQPGIESLNDHVLRLMRKGTTAFQNIELLKWCSEYGVRPSWNLLYGFPGETASDYSETLAFISAIWHLEPPTGYGPIRLDRFSPYHADPSGFGLVNVRPMAPFSYLYPFDRQKLMEISYYFDFDYADGRSSEAYAAEAIETIRSWKADPVRGMLELSRESDGTIHILDTRRDLAAAPRKAALRGWKAAVYLGCDRAQTMERILLLPETRREGVSAQEVCAFLRRCVQYQLMVHDGRRWLALAVHRPARED